MHTCILCAANSSPAKPKKDMTTQVKYILLNKPKYDKHFRHEIHYLSFFCPVFVTDLILIVIIC
jgi:hypothetical protein